jgi:PII-like signaling protein
VNEPGIKLTTYFDERARVRGGFLADALCDLYGRHQIRTSVLLRGVEGFGVSHPLQSDRLLSLSESLPAVSIAIDSRARVQQSLPDVLRTATHGLVSLERAQLITGEDLDRFALPPGHDHAIKLTLYGGRSVRSGGRAGYVEAVDVLRRCGVAGASVLLAVDGTLHGERRRARFFARNANVPLMLLAIGDADSINSALPRVSGLLEDAVATIERVQVCKSDGHVLSPPDPVPESDAAGLPILHKLMIHAEEQAKVAGHPLYRVLVARLREAGAAGATVLRGVRGFYAGRPPVADRLVSVRRNVPVHVVVVDTPSRMAQWWPIIDQATGEAGLITSELVPASHAVRAGRRARLALARTPTTTDSAP